METIFNIVMLGETGVGKTSIVQRFVAEKYNDNNNPTIGASFISKSYIIPNTNLSMKFQIWDTAGQEKYKSLASMYYRDAHAAIIVYDITNKSSYDAIKNWVSELKSSSNKDIFIVIVGNKADLVHKEEIDVVTSKEYSDSISALFKQTSAKENMGIEDLFIFLGTKLSNMNVKIQKPSDAIQLNNDSNQKENKKGCCSK